MNEDSELTVIEEPVNLESSVNLDEKLKNELSLKDNKDDVRQVVENAIEIKVGGLTANDEKLINKLVENKAEILKEQSKAEIKINKHKNEKDTTEAITAKDRAFFERNKELLKKANITEACAKPYMQLLLCIIVPISFITNLISLAIKVPFEVINVFATGIDTLFIKIASFSVSARRTIFSLLVIAALGFAAYIVYSMLLKYGAI